MDQTVFVLVRPGGNSVLSTLFPAGQRDITLDQANPTTQIQNRLSPRDTHHTAFKPVYVPCERPAAESATHANRSRISRGSTALIDSRLQAPELNIDGRSHLGDLRTICPAEAIQRPPSGDRIHDLPEHGYGSRLLRPDARSPSSHSCRRNVDRQCGRTSREETRACDRCSATAIQKSRNGL